jgi:hypothetical protein
VTELSQPGALGLLDKPDRSVLKQYALAVEALRDILQV